MLPVGRTCCGDGASRSDSIQRTQKQERGQTVSVQSSQNCCVQLHCFDGMGHVTCGEVSIFTLLAHVYGQRGFVGSIALHEYLEYGLM